MEFDMSWYAYKWQFLRFDEEDGDLLDKTEHSLQKFQLPEYLKQDAALQNQLSRSEIKEENGEWQIPAELELKILSEGGEALVFSEKFGDVETAVRVQIFDPFLFTDDFSLHLLTWKIHFEKGQFFLSFLDTFIKILNMR